MAARHARRPESFRWRLPALIVVVWLVLGGLLGPLSNKLPEVTRSGSAAYLPSSAEATRALELAGRFGDTDSLPGVLVYTREGGLTDADTARARADAEKLRAELGLGLAADPTGPIRSKDGQAQQIVLIYASSDMAKLAPLIDRTRSVVGTGGEGLAVHLAGPAATQADIQTALGAIDGRLVLVTAVVILVILVLVYRSPLLPLVVLAVAGTTLGVAQGVIYLLARAGALTMGSEVQGILSVLVLGCATDYALLIVARFREELNLGANRVVGMVAAWRACVMPILASAGTVVIALLFLVFSDLGLNAELGPAGAIGIACAVLGMLTFLPAVLGLLGRTAFWPQRLVLWRRNDGGRLWGSVAALLRERTRLVWACSLGVLAVAALGVLGLHAEGLPKSDLIVDSGVDSKLGQRALEEHFPGGAGNPAIVIMDHAALATVSASVEKVPGVATVEPFTGDGHDPVVVDGLSRIDVTLRDAPDSAAALDTVSRLRAAAHVVQDANAVVGGYTAVELDFRAAARRDRAIIPVLLAVVFVMVGLLLRSLVAPVVLVGTVVLSFLAAMGVSAAVFQGLLGFPGVDSTFPLHAFVFLVALGVDYNIFLMTRVREEAIVHGTRSGVLTGLALTGGVVTSAGVVLAATFAALAVIPLVLMVELAFVVAFGVLLDTLLVRSLLVPALGLELGRWLWWPWLLAADDRRAGAARTNGSPAPDDWVARHRLRALSGVSGSVPAGRRS